MSPAVLLVVIFAVVLLGLAVALLVPSATRDRPYDSDNEPRTTDHDSE